MAKGTKTARELEDMIMDRLGIGGVFVAGLQAAEHPSVDETAIIDTATSPPKPSRYVEARPGRLRRLGCLAHFRWCVVPLGAGVSMGPRAAPGGA
jgi:hypothetical protein